jgi:hypothetical protein
MADQSTWPGLVVRAIQAPQERGWTTAGAFLGYFPYCVMPLVMQAVLGDKVLQQVEWDRKPEAGEIDEVRGYMHDLWSPAHIEIRSFSGAEAEALAIHPIATIIAAFSKAAKASTNSVAS